MVVSLNSRLESNEEEEEVREVQGLLERQHTAHPEVNTPLSSGVTRDLLLAVCLVETGSGSLGVTRM